MTEQDKDILTGRMIDNPESLSDSDIAIISADEELREIYNMSVAVGNACASRIEIDAAAEWKAFRPRLAGRRLLLRRSFLCAASAVVAVIILIGGFMSTRLVRLDREMGNMASALEQTAADSEPCHPGAPDIDVDEYVRVQQARIDNEMAVALARVYEDTRLSMLKAKSGGVSSGLPENKVITL